MAPNASKNWAPKRENLTQVFDLARNPKTSGPGLTQRSRFSKRCFSVPDPEFTPEADTSCGHAKNRRLAVIGSLAPGLIAAVLGAGLGLSFGHDALGYPACLAVGGFFVLLVVAGGREGRACRSAFAAWIGLCFGLGEFFAGMSWFPSSIAREWPQLSVAPEYLLLVYLGSYHALTGALFGAFAQRLRPRGAGWFVALTFAFACAWMIPEITRGTAMTGLPILTLGYEMVGTPLNGSRSNQSPAASEKDWIGITNFSADKLFGKPS